MKKSIKPFTKFVVCIDNADYPVALELHKIYRAVPDEEAAFDGDMRVEVCGENWLARSESRHGFNTGDKIVVKSIDSDEMVLLVEMLDE